MKIRLFIIYILITILSYWRFLHGFTALLDPIMFGSIKIFLFDFILIYMLIWIFLNLKIVTFVWDSKLGKYKNYILIFTIYGIIPFLIGLIKNTYSPSQMSLFLWVVLIPYLYLSIRNYTDLKKLLNYWISIHLVKLTYIFIFEVIIPGRWFYRLGRLGDTTSNFDTFDRIENLAIFIILLYLTQAKWKSTFEKVIIYLGLPLSLIIIIVDSTRTIYISIIIALFFFLLKLRKMKRVKIGKYFISLGLIIVIALIGNLDLYLNIVERIITIFNYSQDNSAMYRIDLWHLGLDRIADNPLFGSGMGAHLNFSYLRINPLHSTYYMDINSTVHNFYLQNMIWGGVLLFIFFLLMMSKMFFYFFNFKFNIIEGNKILLIWGFATIIPSSMIVYMFFPGGPEWQIWMWFNFSVLILLNKFLGSEYRSNDSNEKINS